MRMVGDEGLIKARHDYEEDMKSKIKPKFEIGEFVEAKKMGKISKVTVIKDKVFYQVDDQEDGTSGTYGESWVYELQEPADEELVCEEIASEFEEGAK